MSDLDLEEVERENISAKEKLKLLELSGRYVFHGSSHQLEVFTPRQAHTLDENKERVPDGPPAVFSSARYEPAIFKAIINRFNDPTPGSWSGWHWVNGKMRFYTVKSALDKALSGEAKGFVYVFDRGEFKPRNEGGHEYTCDHEVRPLLKVEVTGQDLPEVDLVEPMIKNKV